ncbi:MAG TPA: TetR/AcrR family transcriptional regulator [Micromonosporaceae bacterium]|nr:TetR/AcrR family transcriptional regulator [Micromonosporaceae bacterium]
MERKRRLTAADWARAALDAIGEQGLAGVSVEPLAARLGATKGSFYWHFPNRNALVSAALALWDDTHTEGIIRAVEDEHDPGAKLRALFIGVTLSPLAPIEVNLLAAADHPLVTPVMRRAVTRRIGYVTSLFTALGFEPADARRRAVLAYSAYLGHMEIVVRMRDTLPPRGPGLDAYLDTVLATLSAGASRLGSPESG